MLPTWHAYERASEYFIFTHGVEQVYTNVKRLKVELYILMMLCLFVSDLKQFVILYRICLNKFDSSDPDWYLHLDLEKLQNKGYENSIVKKKIGHHSSRLESSSSPLFLRLEILEAREHADHAKENEEYGLSLLPPLLSYLLPLKNK